MHLSVVVDVVVAVVAVVAVVVAYAQEILVLAETHDFE